MITLITACSPEPKVEPEGEVLIEKSFDNGQKMIEGMKVGEDRIGTWNWYYPNGSLRKRAVYENSYPGKLVQAQEYYSNSILKEDTRLLPMSSADQKTYIKSYYHINGIKDKEVEYTIRYYSDGDRENETTEAILVKYDVNGIKLYEVHDSDQSKKYRFWYDLEGNVIGKEQKDDI
ncbi:hypothetical protein O3Q51_17040 [Cryomorphaceae bacterium 1068]|nr:hypothetical protein [Cryomorphaceae bacterium 1068]